MREIGKQVKDADPRFDFGAMDDNRLGMEDTFTFDCKACGECCRDRDDILLSPYDVYRSAKCLELEPLEFFKKYCETYIGPSSGIPLIRLLPKPIIKSLYRVPPKHNTVCPLLQTDGKCKVHKAKPTVCALFPLGRFTQTDQKTSKVSLHYYQQNGKCRARNNPKTHKVKDWLADFDLSDSEEAFLVWSDFTSYACMEIQKFKKMSDRIKQLVYNLFFGLAYMNFDLAKGFMPQFKQNIETFKKLHKEAVESLH